MDIKDIKFKAKRLDNEEWIEGSLIKRYFNSKEQVYIMPLFNTSDDIKIIDVNPTTVCQFTGLKDCNGNEIWKGDILQDVDYDKMKYVVIFGEGTFLARKEGLYIGIPLHECLGDSGNVTYAKVVGNKFDKEK